MTSLMIPCLGFVIYYHMLFNKIPDSDVGQNYISLMLMFFSRKSDTLIPNIFNFLVMLSYEKFHSKPVITMPKIIQLCDGIMASGLDPTTHGIDCAFTSIIACYKFNFKCLWASSLSF